MGLGRLRIINDSPAPWREHASLEIAMAIEATQKPDERTTTGEHLGTKADPRPRLIQADATILRLSNGVTLAVPRSLQSFTTYVLLEQETWFEKELTFLPHALRPGMTAIDIGANLGVYSLAMARLVVPGPVFAYEPASEPRALLERSRELNQASNLEISAAALSDGRREGHLAFGKSSELNTLADSGPGERVQITSLDLEEAKRGWPAPDFVKIDAEGEEERILAGGAKFFARHSPLVMFERAVSERLLSIFPTMGYRLYRSLPATPVLVPADPDEASVNGELNLFAAKPDRAQVLAQAGLLLDDLPEWQPDSHVRADALTFWQAQAFAPVFTPMLQDLAALDPDYRDVLGAYAIWRTVEKPLPERCAALFYAFRLLSSLCQRAANFARLSTLARIAWEAGERATCVRALGAQINDLQQRPFQINEPFWPASPRFDTVAANGSAGGWFLTSVLEQYERTFAFSSLFGKGSPGLDWLCQQPLASIEMHRRRALLTAGAGQYVEVPPQLCAAAPDHLNAELWRTGQVPGTSLAA
jgi:FkbM family methyltransferase